MSASPFTPYIPLGFTAQRKCVCSSSFVWKSWPENHADSATRCGTESDADLNHGHSAMHRSIQPVPSHGTCQRPVISRSDQETCRAPCGQGPGNTLCKCQA